MIFWLKIKVQKLVLKMLKVQLILGLLFEACSSGLLPNDLAKRLERFKTTRFQVSRRILRMNRRLEKEFGENIAERRGWHWAVTSFVIESWGDTEKKPSEM